MATVLSPAPRIAKPLSTFDPVSPVDPRPVADRRQRRREADIRLDLAMEVLEGGYWHLDIATGAFETSLYLARFLAGPQTAPLDLAAYLALILPEDIGNADLSPLVSGAVDRSAAEYRMQTADGLLRWMRCTRRLVRDEQDRPARVIGVAVDVTEQKRLQASIEQQARTDALTGLANRRAFEERAATDLQRVQTSRKSQDMGILLLDLDGFKPVNDLYGHLVGDTVLRTVARRLLAIVRPIDLVARLGGDEFAVAIEGADGDTLSVLADRLVAAIAAPMALEGHDVSVGCSVGAAVACKNDESVADLVGRADAALYAAKRAGRRTWRLAA